MDRSYAAREDVVVLSHHESGGPLGYLPVHAYLIKAREPILVETGLYTETEGFVEALREQIDPAELRVHDVGPARFASAIAGVRALAPELVLATHGVPVRGQTDVLCDHLAALPAEAPFEFPDDAAFRAMLKQMKEEHSGLAA